MASGKLLRTLEGPVDGVHSVRFSPDGRFLAAKEGNHSRDKRQRYIWLWRCDTWEQLTRIPETASAASFQEYLAFHPTLPLLVSVGSREKVLQRSQVNLIDLWKLDLGVLLGQRAGAVSP